MQYKLIVLITLFSGQTYSQIDLSVRLDAFLKKSKSVAPLNLAAEKIFTPQDLIITIPENKPSIPEKRILTSPKIIKIPKMSFQPITGAKLVVAPGQPTNVPPVTPLAKINDPVIKTDALAVNNLTEISADEYKMIQGLIFFEIQKKYDVAMSLFIELAETPLYKPQAQLQYAESANALGLPSEYRQKILQLTENVQDKSIKLKTVQSLVQNIRAFETSDMQQIENFVASFNIDISKNDTYLYKKAKYLISQGNLSSAENTLSQISPKSDLYADAVLLATSLNYRKGEVNKAIAKLEKVIPAIEHDKKSIVRNSLIATLARLYFQKGRYKESYQQYLKIDRSSPLWLQSVVEQAWAQILYGDYIGAAGNMFSLHTEVFKKTYLPESYIVRSVGYLNLCQYGDALHVLTDLDSRFKKNHEKLIKFQSENKNTLPYYDLVKAWFSNSGQSEINSLPRSFVAELAVHPSFTNAQKQINNYEEENFRFNKISADFSNKETLIRQHLGKIKAEVQTLKNQKVSADIMARNEIQSFIADIELQIIRRGQNGLQKMRQAAQARIENQKSNLRNIAAGGIKERYSELVVLLEKLLEQEEILAYEVYSGAGEHIRYQIAGGKIDERTPAALTPEEKKSYKWKFRGEVWEDEIGHYRSSLKNVCASDDLAQTKGDQ